MPHEAIRTTLSEESACGITTELQHNNYLGANEDVADPEPLGRITSASAPTVSFSTLDTTGVLPHEVTFVNSVAGGVNLYQWEFGDGITSYEYEPVHTYSEAGTYTVKLIAEGPGGSDSMEREDYITVTEEE